MSKEFEFEEILNDGLLGGQMEPIRFKNPDLNRHMDKLLEVHSAPGEVFCLMDPSRFKFKVDPNIQSLEARPIEGEPTKILLVAKAHRASIHGIGDDSE